MLVGNKINLRIMEKEDMPIVRDWVNNGEFVGDFEPITQETLPEIEKQYESLNEGQWFFGLNRYPLQQRFAQPSSCLHH